MSFETLTQYKLSQLLQMCLQPQMMSFAVAGFSAKAVTLSLSELL